MKRISSRPLRLVFRPLKMEGRVLDGADRPLAGVKISFRERLIAVSDSKGRFVFVVYDPVDLVAVTFEAAGYSPLTRCWRREEFDGKRKVVVMPSACHEASFSSGSPQRLKLGPLRLRLRSALLEDAAGAQYAGAAHMQLTWNSGPAIATFPDSKMVIGFQLNVTAADGSSLRMTVTESDCMTLAWPGELGMQLFHLDSTEGKWLLVATAEDVGAGETKAFRMAAGTGSYLLTMPDKPWQQVEAQVVDALSRQPLEGISVWARAHKVDQRHVTDRSGRVWLSCPPDVPLLIDAHGNSGGHHYLLPAPVTFDAQHHLTHCGTGGNLRPPMPSVQLEMRQHRMLGDWLQWQNAPLMQ